MQKQILILDGLRAGEVVSVGIAGVAGMIDYQGAIEIGDIEGSHTYYTVYNVNETFYIVSKNSGLPPELITHSIFELISDSKASVAASKILVDDLTSQRDKALIAEEKLMEENEQLREHFSNLVTPDNTLEYIIERKDQVIAIKDASIEKLNDHIAILTAERDELRDKVDNGTFSPRELYNRIMGSDSAYDELLEGMKGEERMSEALNKIIKEDVESSKIESKWDDQKLHEWLQQEFDSSELRPFQPLPHQSDIERIVILKSRR